MNYLIWGGATVLFFIILFLVLRMNSERFLYFADILFAKEKYKKALIFYKLASFLGFKGNAYAYVRLANYYTTGEHAPENMKKSMRYLLKGAKKGIDDCYARIAMLTGAKSPEKALFYWKKYFNSGTFQSNDAGVAFEFKSSNPIYRKVKYASGYLQAVYYGALPLIFYEEIKMYRKEIMLMHVDAFRYFKENKNYEAAKRRKMEFEYCKNLFFSKQPGYEQKLARSSKQKAPPVDEGKIQAKSGFLNDEKYPMEVWDYIQSISDTPEGILLGLRGHWYQKTDKLIIRLVCLMFIFPTAWPLFNMATGGDIDYYELLICVGLIAFGVFMFILTLNHGYFDDDHIYSIGLFNKIIWKIKKDDIEEIRLVKIREQFHANYRFEIWRQSISRHFQLDSQMKEHIELMTKESLETFVDEVDHLSPEITLKSFFRLIVLVAVSILILGVIIYVLAISGWI